MSHGGQLSKSKVTNFVSKNKNVCLTHYDVGVGMGVDVTLYPSRVTLEKLIINENRTIMVFVAPLYAIKI